MKNVIYGAGVYGEIFLKEIELQGINIDFVVDQFTLKKEVCSKPIKRLDEVSLIDANIYISITSPLAELEVIQTLKASGAKTVHTFIDTLHMFPSLVRQCVEFTKTWYTPIKEDMIDMKKLDVFRSLLKDKKSLNVLDGLVKFRTELSPESYPTPELEPQYFPRDISLFEHIDEIRFIDGGAFIGDTLAESILEFERSKKKVRYIASFEPDSVNIDKLSIETKKQKNKYPNIDFFIYPCGLWSSNEFLKFSNNNDSNSSIVNQVGDSLTTITTVPLDKTLIGSEPNYIKMDIEGAEKEAILGAKNLIAETSPVLAVCLYHKPKDLWELPLLINEINPNYNMYLRVYGSMSLEIVLYCVPRDV
ncbi:MAG: FkbM family methyltransferase [Campylobacterota bacterium]|nr:FkbM family methyltransferase [Campylobacterota bacterium]